MKSIVLASQSRYKRALFERLGLVFTAAAPAFEESVVPDLSPSELAEFLAVEKARSLASTHAQDLIIGTDQVLCLGDEIFTKPETTQRAVAQLQRLVGKTHCLHTAYALLEMPQGDLVQRVVTSKLRFYGDLSIEFLRRLVIQDKTQDCVGAYKFEEHGILLVESVETPDPNAITGLPLISLVADLRQKNYFSEDSL